MFGFPVYPEFLRVLKPGAVLIQVDTGTDHLRELRNIIYAGQKLASDPDSSTIDGFTLNRSQQLRYTLELDSAATIADLLAMTPHYYRASSSGREKLEALNRLSVTVDIKISCYRSLSET